jgi:hypothetical protein
MCDNLVEFPSLQQSTQVHILQDRLGDYFHFLTNEYSHNNDILEDKVRTILDILRKELNKRSQTIQNAIYLSILDTMFSSIAYVRDIHNGLGQRNATYAILHVMYDFYPMLSISALKHIVSGDYYQYGYGSWRDICGLCEYLRKSNIDHPLIDNAIGLMNAQIEIDWKAYQNHGICSTNCAKWVPREKSKHGWLFDKLVAHWIEIHSPGFLQSERRVALLSGCKRQYRKMISAITAFISPMEIHMCARNYASVEMNQLHNRALSQNWDLLFNQSSSLDVLHTQTDRRNCSQQLSHSIQQDIPCAIGYKTHIGKNIQGVSFPDYIGKYVRRAIRCILRMEIFSEQPTCSARLSEEINILNKKWIKISHLWNKKKCIKEHDLAVICYNCVSIHDPNLHYVIAQACLVSEWSGVKRVLYSAHNPIWINLDICDGFIAKVRAIYFAIRHENLICSTPDIANTFLGPEQHPFNILFINEHGWCNRQENEETDYYQLWSILEQPRYKAIHRCFAQIVGTN